MFDFMQRLAHSLGAQDIRPGSKFRVINRISTLCEAQMKRHARIGMFLPIWPLFLRGGWLGALTKEPLAIRKRTFPNVQIFAFGLGVSPNSQADCSKSVAR